MAQCFSKVCKLLIALMIVSLPVFAGCPKCEKPKPKEPKPKSNKLYVTPSDVSVEEQGIHVKLGEEIVPTSALYVDAQGLYVYANGPETICPEGKWKCKKCFDCNANYNNYCQTCWTPGW